MPITLDLPLELERELSAEAAQHNLPLAEYALQILADARRGKHRNELTSPFVSFLQAAEPIRPEALAAMERAIEEDLETINPRDW